MSLEPLPRLCPGGTVVCIASGPSLTREDVDYVQGKATVIAINDAVRWAPWADVVCSVDQIWWAKHYRALRTFPGIKVRTHAHLHKVPIKRPSLQHCAGCFRRLPLAGQRCWCEGIVTMRNAGVAGLALEPDAICTGHNSGTAGINVAVHLGPPATVLLLGYDMGPDSKGRRHFYDTEASAVTSPFMKFRKHTATMAGPLKAAGIRVLNCSRKTALTCFERADLREALA